MNYWLMASALREPGWESTTVWRCSTNRNCKPILEPGYQVQHAEA